MELLEIEKELAEKGEEAMRRYDLRLVGLRDRLDAALRLGVPPDEFQRCEALQDAIVVARKLLRLQLKA